MNEALVRASEDEMKKWETDVAGELLLPLADTALEQTVVVVPVHVGLIQLDGYMNTPYSNRY